ncbi:hypothetical protein [Thermaerobacter litoralis]
MDPTMRLAGGRWGRRWRLAVTVLALVAAGALLATPLLAAAGTGSASAQGHVVTRAQVLAEAAAVFASPEAGAQAAASGQVQAGGQGGPVSTGDAATGLTGRGPAAGAEGAPGPVLGLWQRIRGLVVALWQKVETTLARGSQAEPAGPAAGGEAAATGTAGEAAARVAGSAGSTLEVDGKAVIDAAAIPQAYRDGVEAAIRAGLVQAGDLTAGGALQPERPATLAWAATVLVRGLVQAGADVPEPNIQERAGDLAGAVGKAAGGLASLTEEQQRALAICLDLGIVQARVEAGAGPALQPLTPLPLEVWRSMLERAAERVGRTLPQDLGAAAGSEVRTGAQGQATVTAGAGQGGGEGDGAAGGAAGSSQAVDLQSVLAGKASLRLEGVLLDSPGLEGLLGSLTGSAQGSAGGEAQAGAEARSGSQGQAAGAGRAEGQVGGTFHLRLRLDDGRVVNLPVDPRRLALQGGNGLFLGIDLAGLLGQRVEVLIQGGTVAEIRPAP